MGWLSVKRSNEDEVPLVEESPSRKRPKHEPSPSNATSDNDDDSDAEPDNTPAIQIHQVKAVHFPDEQQVSAACCDRANLTAMEHNECFYAPQDYLYFLKELHDTLRVYQSVRGDMRLLQDHYTVRGVEHLTEMYQHLEAQRNQREAVTNVVQAARRNCSAESIRQMSLDYSAASVRRALARAATVEVVPSQTAADSPRHNRHLSPSGIFFYSPASAHHQRKRVPVDIPSLRAMNARLLQQVRHQDNNNRQPPRLVTPLTSADSTRRMLLQSALNVPFPGIHNNDKHSM